MIEFNYFIKLATDQLPMNLQAFSNDFQLQVSPEWQEALVYSNLSPAGESSLGFIDDLYAQIPFQSEVSNTGQPITPEFAVVALDYEMMDLQEPYGTNMLMSDLQPYPCVPMYSPMMLPILDDFVPNPHHNSFDAVKVKRHKNVGRACTHCKKAHLACDESRPCKRCTHLGKTNCVDVQHKRRGRPKSSSTSTKGCL
ncbi:hypothetical protein L0F63_006151 [Massospora cicadina]|nr:hypothetical protein L0F63_006151 [Massospora cicadina]